MQPATLMIRLLQFIAFLFLVFNLIESAAGADDEKLNSQAKEALNIIAEFADRLCESVPTEGSTQNLELAGDIKTDLNGVLKKLANLGLQGVAKYQESEYQGVLQKDLTELVRDSANCRMKVWNDLKDKLIPEASSEKLRPINATMTKDGKPHKPNYIKGSSNAPPP